MELTGVFWFGVSVRLFVCMFVRSRVLVKCQEIKAEADRGKCMQNFKKLGENNNNQSKAIDPSHVFGRGMWHMGLVPFLF